MAMTVQCSTTECEQSPHARTGTCTGRETTERLPTPDTHTPSACARTQSHCTTPLVLAHHLCSEELEPRRFGNSTTQHSSTSHMLLSALDCCVERLARTTNNSRRSTTCDCFRALVRLKFQVWIAPNLYLISFGVIYSPI